MSKLLKIALVVASVALAGWYVWYAYITVQLALAASEMIIL